MKNASGNTKAYNGMSFTPVKAPESDKKKNPKGEKIEAKNGGDLRSKGGKKKG